MIHVVCPLFIYTQKRQAMKAMGSANRKFVALKRSPSVSNRWTHAGQIHLNV